MTRTYTYACELSWGGDTPTAELEVECSYTVAWGSPESGRFGLPEHYDPGGPNIVEDIKILTVGGGAWPVDISYGQISEAAMHEMLTDKLEIDHEEAMILAAIEEEGAREDAAADYLADQRREDMLAEHRDYQEW